MLGEPSESRAICPHCHSPISESAVYCGQCGKEIRINSPEPHTDVFEKIRPSLLYYFLTLLALLIYKATSFFPEGFEGMLWITVIDVTIVIVFWIYFHDSVRQLFSITKLKGEIVLLVLIGATSAAFIVSLVANWINISIHSDEFYDTYLFQDTAFPLAISILFICVQPAIFEEVAFRGFLFNNLQNVASTTGAVYVTSFMFGIMHLSYISLIWLVPLGIISALMRTRFDTLWYGMIAHFTYNLTIVLIDFQIF